MREAFEGYYRPSEEQFQELWEEGIIALDANVLLNIYRYSPNTRRDFLASISAVGDRLWVPHQAALEFHRNRAAVIVDQENAYGRVRKALEEIDEVIRKKFESYGRHPQVDAAKIARTLHTAIARQRRILDLEAAAHPRFLDHDPLLEQMAHLLAGKIGLPYPEDKMAEIYRKGQERYAKKVPPGFMDAANKDGDLKYGDLVLWFQLLDQSKATGKGVILVCDDRKDDWWCRTGGKTIGPRLELMQELFSRSGRKFWMYESDRFIEHAAVFLNQPQRAEAVKEIREVRQESSAQAEHNADSSKAMSPSRLMELVTAEVLEAYREAMSKLNTAAELSRRYAAQVASFVSPTEGEQTDEAMQSCGHRKDDKHSSTNDQQ